MDRRRFLLTSLAGAFAAPLAADAQPPGKIWRIGVLTGNPPSSPVWVVFQEALRDLGYVEGKNIVTKYQGHRVGDDAHLRRSAAELVTAGVDVIVATSGTSGALAAKAATTIPIVMVGAVQVVETGIVKSLRQPGTNVTGQTWDVSTEEAGKRIELFKRLVPNVSR